jgi:hypothetical protein
VEELVAAGRREVLEVREAVFVAALTTLEVVDGLIIMAPVYVLTRRRTGGRQQ